MSLIPKEVLHNKIWSFDIDGVLNDYPKIWLDYIFNMEGLQFNSTEFAKKALGPKYKIYKNEYRLSNYKYNVPVYSGAIKLIESLKQNGNIIYISTSRPFDLYPKMYEQTFNWLKNNNIKFDKLISKNLLGINFNFDVHIDNEIAEIKLISNNCTESKIFFHIHRETETRDEISKNDAKLTYVEIKNVEDLLLGLENINSI